ncbi:MAG TPA: peptidylprolyl isomerase [Rhodopila sp.]
MIRRRGQGRFGASRAPNHGAVMPPRVKSRGRDVICRALLLATVGLLLSAAGPTPSQPEKPAKPRAATANPAPPSGDAAQEQPKKQEQPPPITGATDPVVASVEGHPIYLSDLGRAEQALPANLRNVPFDTLYPVLLDRMVDHEALVMLARRRGLEDVPAVKKEIQDATERVLEGALLATEVPPKVTEAAVKGLYDRLYANKPATEEVRARHILVTTEAEAKQVISQLKAGADFATLAKQISKDPDAQKGGDLGFFRRDQVWPGFADIAFALQPGQVADTPIHNEFGWHVVKVEERRLVAPPAYSEIHDSLREELTQQVVRQAVAQARSQMTIHKWNLDGSSMDGGARLGAAPTRPQ